MSDIVERLFQQASICRDSKAIGLITKRRSEVVMFEAAAEITRLQAERDALLIALHDAIRRPMGVVPASADPFYNPVFAAQAEVRRIEKEATMSEGVGG